MALLTVTIGNLQKSGGSILHKNLQSARFVEGQMMEFSDDCRSIYESFLCCSIHSWNIMEGYWTL